MHTSTCLGTPKTHSIPWYLFIFHRHSLPEPASVVCDFEQGDIFYSAGPHIEFLSVWCYRSSSVSFPLNVMLHIITNLTQSPSVWCYGAALINLFQCDWQIIHHPSLSVWCHRSSIIHLCQCDVTDHTSSNSVSMMLQIIHHQSLSVWCYRSSIIKLCQCEVTDHPSPIPVSVRSQIIHHQSLSVWCYRSSIINLCQCDGSE